MTVEKVLKFKIAASLCLLLMITRTLNLKAQNQNTTGRPLLMAANHLAKPLTISHPQGLNSITETVKLDTLQCLFHEIFIDNHPALSWKKGFIVLVNQQILINDTGYPTANAVQLTGVMQNTFLRSNKKTPVKNKVIQVIML